MKLGCVILSMVMFVAGLTAQTNSLYTIAVKTIDGEQTTLKTFEGKVLLVVNVASECGFTPQYKPLEAIYNRYKEKGFVVLGFPSNDFGGQEPGTHEEIKQFCKKNYDITFPLFEKVVVKNNKKQHPLYAALTGKDSPFPGEVKWNFGKFLIGKTGKIVARFEPGDEPSSEEITRAIEKALKE